MPATWPDQAAIEAAVELSITTPLRAEDALRYLEEGWSADQIKAADAEAARRGCAVCEVLMERRALRGRLAASTTA